MCAAATLPTQGSSSGEPSEGESALPNTAAPLWPSFPAHPPGYGNADRKRDVGNTNDPERPAKLFATVDELLGKWDKDQPEALGAAPAPPPLHPPGRWEDYSKLNDLEKLTVLQRLELRRARARLKLAFAEECVLFVWPPALGLIPEDDVCDARRAVSKRRAAGWARRREWGGGEALWELARARVATTGDWGGVRRC